MNEIAFLVEDAAAGGFIAHAVGAAEIRVEARTMPELQLRVLAAVLLHFDDAACRRMPVRLYACSTRQPGDPRAAGPSLADR
jgi:hypothetical protein